MFNETYLNKFSAHEAYFTLEINNNEYNGIYYYI